MGPAGAKKTREERERFDAKLAKDLGLECDPEFVERLRDGSFQRAEGLRLEQETDARHYYELLFRMVRRRMGVPVERTNPFPELGSAAALWRGNAAPA